MADIKCIVCKKVKPESRFPVSHLKRTIGICNTCNFDLDVKTHEAIRTKTIACKYRDGGCSYSRAKLLCCHECPQIKYCDRRCLNTPDKCGSKE